jgi:hypothetical protein
VARSIITTDRPLPRAAIAAANPAPPEPITARSYRIRLPPTVALTHIFAYTNTSELTSYLFIRIHEYFI